MVNRGHLSSNIWLVILETSASVDILEIPEQNDTVLIWCVLAREMQNSAQPKNLGKSGYNIYIFWRVIVFTHPFIFLSFYKKAFCFWNGKWCLGSGVQRLCFHRGFYLTLQCAFLLLLLFIYLFLPQHTSLLPMQRDLAENESRMCYERKHLFNAHKLIERLFFKSCGTGHWITWELKQKKNGQRC